MGQVGGGGDQVRAGPGSSQARVTELAGAPTEQAWPIWAEQVTPHR